MSVINRESWPVKISDIMINRLLFLSFLSSFILYSLFLYLVRSVGTLSRTMDGFEDRGIILLIIILIPTLIMLLLRVTIRKENVTWQELNSVGDKRLLGYDLSNMLFCLVFAAASILLAPDYMIDYLVLTALVVIGFMLNASSEQDTNWAPVKEDESADVDISDGGDQSQYQNQDHGGEEYDDGSEKYYYQTYSWRAYEKQYQIERFPISNKAYNEARALNMNANPTGLTLDEFAQRVVHDPDGSVKTLARRIAAQQRDNNLILQMDCVFQFIHEPNFIYKLDHETHPGHPEYARFPIETMHDRVGDCECLSILLCALFNYSGFKSAFLVVNTNQGYHAMAGLAVPFNIPGNWVTGNSGTKYMLCEATGAGCVIGGYYFRSLEIHRVMEFN